MAELLAIAQVSGFPLGHADHRMLGRSVLVEEELSVISQGTPQPAALAAYQVVEVEHRAKRAWLLSGDVRPQDPAVGFLQDNQCCDRRSYQLSQGVLAEPAHGCVGVDDRRRPRIKHRRELDHNDRESEIGNSEAGEHRVVAQERQFVHGLHQCHRRHRARRR